MMTRLLDPTVTSWDSRNGTQLVRFQNSIFLTAQSVPNTAHPYPGTRDGLAEPRVAAQDRQTGHGQPLEKPQPQVPGLTRASILRHAGVRAALPSSCSVLTNARKETRGGKFWKHKPTKSQ